MNSNNTAQLQQDNNPNQPRILDSEPNLPIETEQRQDIDLSISKEDFGATN